MSEIKSQKRILSIIVVTIIVIASLVIAINLQATPGSFIVQAISDDSDGAIIAWWAKNSNSSGGTIYIQRINSEGQTLWGGNGISVTDNSWSTFSLSPDGSGGAIVTWSETGSRYFSQRVSTDGRLLWDYGIEHPHIIGTHWAFSDVAGEVVILWQESNFIYVQHISEEKFIWEDPVEVCEIQNRDGLRFVILPEKDTDGDVNLFFRTDVSYDHVIYKCTDLYGEVLWEIEYRGTSPDNYIPKIICDGNDEFLFVRDQIYTRGEGKWETVISCRIYVQKVALGGGVSWGAKPIIETGPGQYPRTEIASDGNGGAFITWRLQDEDKYQAMGKLFIQRVDAQGDSSWDNEGIPVFPDTGLRYQGVPSIVGTSSGPAIVIAAVGKGPVEGDMIYTQKFDMYGNKLWDTAMRIDR